MLNLKSLLFKDTPRSLLIFYVLVVYVFLQFCWWSYLLFDLNAEILVLREQLARFSGDAQLGAENILKEKIAQKRLMIFGEGIVFLLLLSLGMMQTRRSFRRETNVARQQKNFLLSVTHELKSPIASVKLYLQTLSKRELSREKQQELLSKAIEEANRLDQLVENILLASRIDNHNFQLIEEDINLGEFLHDFIDSFELKAHKPILTNIASNIHISADSHALHSIFSNLFENAVKYSGEDLKIELSLSQVGNTANVIIKDNGIGISDEDKLRIFDKFYRVGNEETRKTKGTGLGLFIVNYLVKTQDAQIDVYNNSPKGSIFELRFKVLEA
jgi:two-component system, OmpR family, phosphate regulon sensor histidine kinase PhoR